MKKNLVRTIALLLCLAMAFSFAGCGKKEEKKPEIDTSTIGGKYLAAFMDCDKTTAADTVTALVDANIFETDLVPMEMVEGYLDGFDADITGFTACVKFSPMIGSIPFVGYVFETTDTEALLKTLEENANPAWNICTEADETVSGSKDNLVFFMMCTNE